jgi:hypothetical protein
MLEYPEFGYYRYLNHTFFDKFEVFEAALACRDHAPIVEFVFPAADALGDCTLEPEADLAELYRRRARRLREQYDYLILMYSGGADSDQVLTTFLKGGIFLDEVRTVYPMRFIERLPAAATPDDPLGLLHEYRNATVVGLRLVRALSPRTRINVVDNTDAFLGDMAEWTLALPGPRISGGTHGLYGGVKKVREGIDLQRHADALNRKVGVIFGVEKPYLRLIGDDLSFFFSDAGRVGVEHVWQHGDQLLYRPEMFYWGDPVITLKQAHVIKRALQNNPAALADVRGRHVNVYVTNGIPGIDLGLIYRDWDWRYQQRDKQRNEELLPAFLGPRVAGIAAERTRFYNDRYGRLTTVARLTDRPPRVGLTETLTRLYQLGSIA